MQIRFRSVEGEKTRSFAVTFWKGEKKHAAYTYATLSEYDVETEAWHLKYGGDKRPLKGWAKRHEGDAFDPRLARRKALERLLSFLFAWEYVPAEDKAHRQLAQHRLSAANRALAEREKPAVTLRPCGSLVGTVNVYGSRETLLTIAGRLMAQPLRRHLPLHNLGSAGWYIYGQERRLFGAALKGFRVIEAKA